jgi:hypothetical protein
MNITVEALINAPIEKVQSAYPSPQDIKQRNAALTIGAPPLRAWICAKAARSARASRPKAAVLNLILRAHTRRSFPTSASNKLRAHNLRKILVKLRLFVLNGGSVGMSY